MLNTFKKIHFVGVKGVGMAPLAIIAKEAGFEVTGSDVSESFITDEQLKKTGIIILEGFDKKNVNNADLVITTGAHGGFENVEVKEAKAKGIPVLSQGEALGKFQSGDFFGKKFKGISVAGSHGKTTTSAMIATMLMGSKLDPSYSIGTGNIPSLGNSGRYGKGSYFVAEADEYFADIEEDKTPKFLYQNPDYIVITNIDFDHPDIFPSISDLRKAFFDFSKKLKKGGVVICCGDGEENRSFLKNIESNKITYGISPQNDYYIEKISYSSEKMFFWVKAQNAILGQISLNVFGDQNAVDALAAIVVGFEIGLSFEQIKKSLSVFEGSKRRSEYIGLFKNGIKIYDDYAHHPREIKETLSSFRKAFPKEKIVVVFQPHMYSRTKILFNDFAKAFSNADQVILCEVFPSFREPIDKKFSSNLLAEEIKKYGTSALYFSSLDNVLKYLVSQKYDKNTIIITMGAGDIYKIGKDLLNG